jgi:glycosyltransferase involved in cell wall biosynthesis
VAPTLWIDVEDLFEYALHNLRPSGIQRLAFQLYASLQEQHGGTSLVRFVRHDTARNTFRAVTWPEVKAAFDDLSARQATSLATRTFVYTPRRRRWRALAHRLPPPVRASLIQAFRTQGLALRSWWRLLLASGRCLRLAPGRHAGRRHTGRDGFASGVARGDVLLALGSPWSHPEYGGLIRAERERHGLRFSLLVYDLSVLLHPEWFGQGLTTSFRRWFNDLLPLCDTVFAISRATAADVTAYACEHGIALPSPVVPLPLGTRLIEAPAEAPRHERQPPAGSYVLYVSTIEARKNHTLLFRIWRRLLDEIPRDRMPTLVFAGRIGWLVDDLMQQIVNTDYLSGRLVVIGDASDAQLAVLYRDCLFTVYPSYFEGWGLPVTESLAFGKPCLASDRTSLPEAGGSLARYIDPDDARGWHDAIRQLITDLPLLASWEAEVRRGFRPVPWSATVRALLAGLRHPASCSGFC